MRRKILFLENVRNLLSIIVLITVSFINANAAVKIGDFYYILDSYSKTAQVTYEYKESTSNYYDLERAVVPNKVTYNDDIYTVTSVGDHAFNRAPFNTVELPSSIRVIYEESLAVMKNLKFIEIPEGVETMYDNVFMKSDIEEIVLPNSLTGIPYGACAVMSYLKKITIGAGVKTIGGEAFNYTNSLTEIVCYATTPPTCQSGRGSTFTSTVLSNATIRVPAESISLYKSADCWKSFKNIVAIDEEGNNEEGDNEGRNEEEVIIPSEGTKIKIDNLYYLLYPSTKTAVVSYDKYQSENNYSGITSISIPSKVMYGNLSYTVTSIGASAFDRCYNVEEVILPSTLTSIGKDGFCSNRKLKEIVIGDKVTSIGYGAFAYNYELEHVTLGSKVESIGGEAFNYANDLTEIICRAPIPPSCQSGRGSIFTSTVFSNATLKVPQGCIDAYQNADTWKKFTNIEEYVLPSGDVNGDNLINVTDVVITISYILGEEPSNFDISAADVNADGKVNVTDVVTIIGQILGEN